MQHLIVNPAQQVLTPSGHALVPHPFEVTSLTQEMSDL